MLGWPWGFCQCKNFPLRENISVETTLSKHVGRSLQLHKPYIPGEQPAAAQKVIKLNTNENPYPPSPAVRSQIIEEIQNLNLYPNPQALGLRKCIAKVNDVNSKQVIVGNGSDDILNLCVRCFSDSQLGVAILDPSYSLYEVLASIQGTNLIRIPFESADFEIPLDSIKQCTANLLFITSPHAPSGRGYSTLEIIDILENFKGLVVIDEAYIDFSKQSALPLLKDFSKLIITRTLSKSYSLAGLRVGYGLANPEIIKTLDQAREVYNVDKLAQVGAKAALEDRDYFTKTRDLIIDTRQRVYSILNDWGWRTIPSATNFIFTQPVDCHSKTGKRQAQNLYQYLEKKGILVRYFPHSHLTDSYVRISIGKSDDMTMLLEKIKEWRIHE